MKASYSAGKSRTRASTGAALILAVTQFTTLTQGHVLPLNNNNGTSNSASPTSSTSSGNSTVGALQSCLQSLSPVFPYSQNYGQDSAPFNQAFSWKPAAIVYPQNTNEVSQAVKCAASSGYKVSARAGGHSYAAFGLGGEE